MDDEIHSLPFIFGDKMLEEIKKDGAIPAEFKSLGDLAREENETEREFMEPKVTKPKGRRGRPKKKPESETQGTPPPEPQPEMSSEPSTEEIEAVKMSLGVGSRILVAMSGGFQGAGLTPAEIDTLTPVYAALIAKHFPGLGSKYGLEFMALFLTGGVIIRIRTDCVQEIARRKEEQKAREAQDSPKTDPFTGHELSPLHSETI